MTAMDPDIKRLLEEIRTLEKENHHILKALRRYQWYGFIWKILLWTSLIVIPIYFYQSFIAPVTPSFLDFGNLLESYQAGQ